LTFGEGHAVLDLATGAPLQFVDPSRPERTFLLDPDLAWHTADHLWGSGHITTERAAARWVTPASQVLGDNSQDLSFALVDGLTLTVSRRGGSELMERYEWRNTSAHEVTVTGLGLQIPFADHYPSAAEALERCVHAHVFPGGTWSWVLAQPMSGEGRCLGLVVREGSVAGYSIESRNPMTQSNIRGHLVLQVTDRARNATAFGGQPAIILPPGGSYTLAWTLHWYGDVDAFLADTAPPARFSAMSAPVGSEIRVETSAPVSCTAEALRVRPTDGGVAVSASRPGSYQLQLDGARTEVLFHLPVRHYVEARAAYILAHQRAAQRPGLLAHALVPVDTRTGLTVDDGGWADWTDGSERIGMAILLQRARNLGWLTDDVEPALAGWASFARAHLVDHTGATRRGSAGYAYGARIYDAPWMAEFFLERYRATGDPADLELAGRVLTRVVELGANTFLGIGYSEMAVAVAEALAGAGSAEAASVLRAHVVTSAEHFLALGRGLPEHEVAYEQSIVAPLLNLLIDAHRLTGDDRFAAGISERLPWLLSFGGPQPHARLQGIAIRHWDGYWFGLDRLWGDVFPHHWSALTATVLTRLPEGLRTERTEELALAILRANLANDDESGSATCAFVMPSSVDGRAAHRADPLANDQDWHLALWLRLFQSEGFGLA
jgi:hypothetical protein